jgi:hypothetical protein
VEIGFTDGITHKISLTIAWSGGDMAEGSHVGRPSSWIAVSVMLVGCVLGGIGLVAGPSWPLFWAGVAIAAIGGVLALAVGIFSDVVMYTPRDIAFSADGVSAVDGTEIHARTTETTAALRDEAPRSGAESPENPRNAENLASG